MGKGGWGSGNGIPTTSLPSGSGVTNISVKDLAPTTFASGCTLAEHTMMVSGKPVLTEARETLHRATIEDLFRDARKPGKGEKKVFTMLGGGSAAGKGAIQKSDTVKFPSATDSPIIDAD